MRFDAGRPHPNFDLNGAQPRGPATIVRAAVDPVRPPEEPRIVELLDKNLCTVKVENNGYTVRNPLGDTIHIPYGAAFDVWTKTCEQLMAQAMEPSRVV